MPSRSGWTVATYLPLVGESTSTCNESPCNESPVARITVLSLMESSRSAAVKLRGSDSSTRVMGFE
eukprot:scaffold191249_cov30-Tisochrysis_lutea.AAC.5